MQVFFGKKIYFFSSDKEKRRIFAARVDRPRGADSGWDYTLEPDAARTAVGIGDHSLLTTCFRQADAFASAALSTHL